MSSAGPLGGPASDETIPAATRNTGSEGGADPSPIARGESIGRYIVVSSLGRGAMGAVYAAVDPDLNRRVAVKVLQRGADRLAREAQALAQLAHPNVVTVFDVGNERGRPFVAMELVEGGSLHAWLDSEPRSETEILDVFVQAGRGLAAAHASGILHRDFKPANVLVSPEGAVKVADFGLAGASNSSSGDSSGLRAGDLQLTVTGAALGTPRFMAPELHAGKRGDEASDQFAFCVALFLALYGVHPFPHDDVPTLVNALSAGNVVVPPGASVPAALRDIVVRGLSHQRTDRFPSIDALLSALEKYRRPRWPLWAKVGGSLGVLAATAAAIAQPKPDPCVAIDTSLTEAWNDEQRAAVARAFGGQQQAFANRARRDALETLDQYAVEWVDARKAACRAALDRTTQDRAPELRISCLEHARGVLAGVAELLATGSAEVVAGAGELTGELPEIARCGAPDAGARMPLPEEREAAAKVLSVATRIDRQWLQRFRGDDTAQFSAIEDLVRDAEATGFRPLVARAIFVRARFREHQEQRELASADAHVALRIALETDFDRLAAVTAAMLLRVDVESARKRASLPVILALADGFLDRWPDDIELQIELLTASAYALSSAGRFEEANQRSERLRQLAMMSGDLRHHNQALAVITMLRFREGRYVESIGAAALEASVTELRLGIDHPSVASSWLIIGRAYAHYGMPHAALDALARRAAIRSGPPIPQDVRARVSESNAQYIVGDYQAAYDSAKRGFALLDALGRADDPLAASLTTVMADAADALGRKHEALGLYQRSITLRRDDGVDEVQIIAPLANMASTYGSLKDFDNAIEHFEEALKIADEAQGKRHPDNATIRAMLGATLIEAGEHVRARHLLDEAIEVLVSLQAGDAPILATARSDLSRVLLALGEHARAIEAADAALASPNLGAGGRCEALLVRASVLRRRGDGDAAASVAETALATKAAGAETSECIDRVTAFQAG
ncbi:MAG: serine/threonine-protein kinase [Myxococcota bacterium]